MKYTNRVIWITGASSGIGEELAYQFAKEKAKLIISARRVNELERVKKNCASNTECTIIPLDLTDSKSIVSAAKQVKEKFGSVYMLINNGGISQRELTKNTSLDVDRRIMEINFFGAVALTKQVLPWMVEQQDGHIVAISSVTGKFGFPLRSAYAASKHALAGFYESLYAEGKQDNIKVSIVYPGRINTNISYHALDGSGTEHGKMDKGQENGMPADVCAKKIIRKLKKNKVDILVGNKELILVHIKRLFPSLFYKLVTKVSET